MDDGLPDNSVRACCQDSDGLIWICTRAGISLYDGFHFKQLVAPDCEILDGLALGLMEDRSRRMWFVTTRGIGYHDLETGLTHTIYNNMTGMLGTASVATDRGGRVWFAAEDVFCWDSSTESFLTLDIPEGFRSATMTEDENGSIWFLDDSGSLYRFDSRLNSFELIRQGSSRDVYSKQAIASDGNGHILFASSDGTLLQTDILTYSTVPLCRTGAQEIRSIIFIEDGTYWIGTDRGILVLKDGQIQHLVHNQADTFSLPGEDVWSMYRDRQGNIWTGFFYNGLSLCQNRSGLMARYYGQQTGGPLSGDMVRPVIQADDSHLLVGAEDGGLSLLDLVSGKAEILPLNPRGKPQPNVQGLCMQDGDVWVATFGDGIFRMDLTSKRVTGKYLPSASSATIYSTASGEILAGTTTGLYRFDRAAGQFVSCAGFEGSFIHTIMEDSRGKIWVGSYGNGIWTENVGAFRHTTTLDRDSGLTSDYITSIREDSRHRIWVCTEAGGACYTSLDRQEADGSFRFGNLSTRDGLPSSVTCCILEDLDHVLWLTTSHGIAKLDPESLSIREIYIEKFGNTQNQYSYGSACATSSGKLLFGTSKGLVSFSPPVKGVTEVPKILITDIVGTGPEGTFQITGEGKSTVRTDKIRISYSDLSSITIRFSIPDFQTSRTGLFETSLRAGRKTIRQSSYVGEATYTDLAPGRYVFSVCRRGWPQQREKVIQIHILPPWYRSTVAFILYAIALLGIIVIITRQFDRIRQMRMVREVEKVEAEKQKDLYDAKINFFTNITHEIRTPLSLIKMPLDKIVASGNYTEESKQDLLTMQANADRLLALTNQLLDLRKVEKMEIKPTFLETDLTALVRKVCGRFTAVAEDQHITIETNLPDAPFQVECAGDMVEKILGNLLSNACKYGDGFIRVSLEPLPEADSVRIRVDSDGDRIPDKDAEHVFEKFYQFGTPRQGKGTGLGLPYARSLAALHGGTLELDRSVLDYNSFVLEIPVHQLGRVELLTPKPKDESERVSPSYDNQLRTILVVDDDPQMRGYLAKELSEQYNVLVASNGEDALTLIGTKRVDLVVSDVMMPGIDGCTLCNRIKTTTEFSHIPVVLLTAAVGMETRIETLEAGADGYIEKPFTISLLKANIANLFKNKEIANKQFTNMPLSHFNSVVTGGVDREFMERLHEVVTKHLAEPDLNIETLTSELGTSKSTLYRKITANTGLNINEYIRVSRLKKAAEMLSSQKFRISEVAYMTGFSTPSYFATCFQKQFNVSPSAFVKGLKDQ